MEEKSASSHREKSPPIGSSVIPPTTPSSTRAHTKGDPADMPLTKTNKSCDNATTNVDKPDAQSSYGAEIIRRRMETWPAFGKPKYFAQKRKDFANVTPWLHGMQTGYWSTNSGDSRNGRQPDGKEKKFCTGLYISGCPPVGQYFDSEVIITGINGPENTDRHTADRKREVEHNVEGRIPIGVAVGKDACKPDEDGVTTFPCPIPEGIDCVALGWFLITHMWPKPSSNTEGEEKTVWMVRLEKIDLSERSWWSNATHSSLPHPSPEERDFETKAAEETCPLCQQTSVRIFKLSFVCLHEQCPNWYTLYGEDVEDHLSNLVYNDDFLSERFNRFDAALAPRPLEVTYPNLYPSLEQFLAKNYPDSQGSEPSITAENVAARNEALLAGISCPQCGMANPRIKYHEWHCRNPNCKDAQGNVSPFTYRAPPPMVTPELLEAERQQPETKAKADMPFSKLLGYIGMRDLASHEAHDFDFGGGCRVTIFRPKKGGMAAEMADHLFKHLQEDAASGSLGLVRRSVSANGSLSLASHFVGERYLLPSAPSDIPLEEVPDVVRNILEAANVYMWEYVGGDKDQWGFNEVRIAAYLSKKLGMSFHDGEKNSGNFIGTLNLGGRATFKVCMKPPYDYGRPAKGGAWMKPQGGEVDPVLVGCTEEAFRTDLRAAFQRGEISKAEWKSQLQAHMDSHMAEPGRKRTYAKRTLVSLAVGHGDLVVVWGDNTQRYLECVVDSRSPMRFAITMRRVTRDVGSA